jgi:formylglycine-generating enzyme required for sulfatase activity
MRGLAAATALLVLAAPAVARDMAPVAGGVYRAVTTKAADEPPRTVAPFRLDRYPVTNADFAAFVAAHPSWRRDRVSPQLADAAYLASWASAVDAGSGAPARAPVVEVSWFAARAYCAAEGARLPSEAEWEIAAAASPTARDGRRDPAWRQRLLSWYAQPNPARLPEVGRGVANAWGIHDLHGLVWEWVSDFSASMLVGADANLCGAAAAGAIDPDDYPAFLRAAFRSAVQARTTTRNLGFRCARDGGP